MSITYRACLLILGRGLWNPLEPFPCSFTSPAKLYVVGAAIFFLCAPLAGFTLQQMLASEPTSLVFSLFFDNLINFLALVTTLWLV